MPAKLAHPPVITGIRHPGRADARAKILDWLATQFTHITPDEMRTAERAVTGSSPVAGRMTAAVR